MFPFSRKKALFTPEENERVVAAIRSCENRTSGEIRVFIESKNPYVEPLERAAELFLKLEMDQTVHRNAVLLYIAVKHREVALFADEGIYKALGAAFWNNEVKRMIGKFKADFLVDGIVQCVLDVGESLHQEFPYTETEDKNELPDEIVFGKI